MSETFDRVLSIIQSGRRREEQPVYILCLRPGTVRALEAESGLNAGSKYAFGYRLIVVDGGEAEELVRVDT